MDDRKFSLRDSEDLKFLFQMLLSLILVGFCIVKLIDDNNDRAALYWGGLTGIIGFWLPSPHGSSGSIAAIAGVIGKKALKEVGNGND